MKKTVSYLILFLCTAQLGFAQNIPEKGVPLLKNYTPAEYQNKGKIWDIETAPNGLVYMAADRGLLEYDGKTWHSYKGSSGFTRSLLVLNDSLIYTGSDMDFGVWKKNRYQLFEYSSLYPFQKEITDLSEEFWDVYQLKDNIVFISSQNIYIYKNLQLTKIAAPNQFTGSFSVKDTLYLADEKNGLYIFNGFALKHLFNYPDDKYFQITGIFPINKGLVLVTKNEGLFLFSSGKLAALNSTLSQYLKKDNVFSFERINDEYLAFGTVLKGLYITDSDGRIIHHINKNKGLPNNTILSMHYAPSEKLWLGMDYGVSALDLRNNLTYFYDFSGDFGTGYTAVLKDGIFYLGTNQGLYQSRWEDLNNDAETSRFHLIPGTEGQVWTLRNIDSTLFIGHDQGLFIFRNNTLRKLSRQHGVWTILPYRDHLLTGNYNGISIFKKSGNNWTFLKNMELILGSCNQLIVEKDDILWVNIPNYGVIRVLLDNNLSPVNRLIFTEDHFEGDHLQLVNDNQGIHVITDQFQYTYEETDQNFTQKTVINFHPKVEGLVSGNYQSDTLNSDYQFYPVYNGFALRYLRNSGENTAGNYTLVFRMIEAFNNDEKVLLYPGATVPFRLNNLKVECIVPDIDNVLYQHKLKHTNKWSNWVRDNSIELYNLPNGVYTLQVRFLINGKTSDAHEVSFRIAVPWYYAWYARIVYVLLFAALIYLITVWQKVSLKKQKKKMLIKERESLHMQSEKHKQEIMLLEQERLQLEYNQLKQQLKSKTIELANKAKDNEDKNRLILTLKEKFSNVQKNVHQSGIRWGEIHRLLDSYLKVEDKTFEIQMDELHQEFFKQLKEKFPGLSTNDLRLCAYLKIGLNSQEIADILNIQPSSAYISRSRLRKKLNLKPEEDLHDFLNHLT